MFHRLFDGCMLTVIYFHVNSSFVGVLLCKLVTLELFIDIYIKILLEKQE